jgi:hypothetical protein
MVARYYTRLPSACEIYLHLEVTLWSIHSENISVPIPVRFRVSPALFLKFSRGAIVFQFGENEILPKNGFFVYFPTIFYVNRSPY